MIFARSVHARIVFFGLPLLGFGVGLGCLGQAEHTYFDDLLDGSADGTTAPGPEASSGTDASMGSDGDVVITTDDGGSDAADDAVSTGDAGNAADAAHDGAAIEAGPDAAPVEAGCGPTSTVTNCGACGVACDTVHATPTSCVAGSCTYSGCDAGWGDCVTTPPNTVACETRLNTVTNCTGCGIACDTTNSVGPGCSSAGCSYDSCKAGFIDCNQTPPNADGCETPQSAVKHSTGIPGVSYYDCAPLKTYGVTQALEACTAYTGDGSQCATTTCRNATLGPIVCSTGAVNKDCVCWSYGGTNIGYVDTGYLLTPADVDGGGGNKCFCPSTSGPTDPMWN
jgi:hypothetical protein